MRRQTIQVTDELVGSVALEVESVGNSLTESTAVNAIAQKRLLLSPVMAHGVVHVYRAYCSAGERVRVQLMVPALPTGRGLAPSIGLVARSLPYSADMERLPIEIPNGFSAVVASAPDQLFTPLRDAVARVLYYPGPVIDTRILVSGVCYIVVWSPQHLTGAYMLSIGHRWTRLWLNWLSVPIFWWRVRGWYGHTRAAAYLVAATTILLLWAGLVWRKRNQVRSPED